MTSVAVKPSPDELTLLSIQSTFPGLQPTRAVEFARLLRSNQIRVGSLSGVTSQVVFDRPFICPPALSGAWKRQVTLRQEGKKMPEGEKFLWHLDGASQLEALKTYLERSGTTHPSLVYDFFMRADTWMIELVVALQPNLKRLVYLPACYQFRSEIWD